MGSSRARGCSSPAFGFAGFGGPVDRSGSGLLALPVDQVVPLESEQGVLLLELAISATGVVPLGAAAVLAKDTAAAKVERRLQKWFRGGAMRREGVVPRRPSRGWQHEHRWSSRPKRFGRAEVVEGDAVPERSWSRGHRRSWRALVLVLATVIPGQLGWLGALPCEEVLAARGAPELRSSGPWFAPVALGVTPGD